VRIAAHVTLSPGRSPQGQLGKSAASCVTTLFFKRSFLDRCCVSSFPAQAFTVCMLKLSRYSIEKIPGSFAN
jgi:hypothetical protein